MFYNCENLFDSFDDSTIQDEEFLPNGDRHWTYKKYTDKLNKTARVITSVGGWKPVDLVGLCEIENEQVLKDLTFKSQLYLQEYRYIHKESQDKRGIDVALLYQPKSIKPISSQFIEVEFSEEDKKSRDILYTKVVLHKTDTLHIFVNHWPSRWEGQLESEIFRVEAAQTLRKVVDSIFITDQNPDIVIMGDFNDTPNDLSLVKYLKTDPDTTASKMSHLINLSTRPEQLKFGTHKYKGVWSVLDQVIVSSSLTDSLNSLFTTRNSFTIVDYNFLLEPDEKYLGLKPYRSFVGFKFNNGYSDHLPVFIDLYKK